MSRFAGAEELTGTRNQALLTNGIYRYSRNPQYLGYLLALAGAGLGPSQRRSSGLYRLLATVYTVWIPVEEEHLAGLYGQPYTDYARRTCRCLGRRRMAGGVWRYGAFGGGHP